MAPPRRAGRSRLTLALLILTSIAVLTLDFRDTGPVEGARRFAGSLFSPLSGVADSASSPFRNGWNGITKYGDVKGDNDRLRERVEELEGEQIEQRVREEEHAALLAEQGIEWVGDIPKVTGRVVSGPTSNFAHSIEIDQGSGTGIKVGMPVVNAKGLVGRVQLVTSSHSVVQLISDPDFRVGVRVVDGEALSGVLGVARGRGEGGPLTVDTGIGAETPPELGGVLTTSGNEESRYPSSIPVGTVIGTAEARGGLTLNLVVEPYVDTQRVMFVSVLLWEGNG